jgi:hypothetical protein
VPPPDEVYKEINLVSTLYKISYASVHRDAYEMVTTNIDTSKIRIERS